MFFLLGSKVISPNGNCPSPPVYIERISTINRARINSSFLSFSINEGVIFFNI